MKTKSVNRLLAISVASLLALMAAAPAVQAAQVPFTEPVYAPCFGTGPFHILVFFDLSNQYQLNGYLNNAYYNPFSPSFHQFLSAHQFDQQYSAPAWVFGLVESVFSANAINIIASGPMLLEGNGTEAAVTSALATLSGEPASFQHQVIGAECMPQTFNVQSTPKAQAASYAPSYAPTDVKGAYVGTSPLASSQNSHKSSCTYQDVITNGPQVWLPCGLQTIYDENPLLNQWSSWSQGPRQTIALVDAYGDPNATLASGLTYQNTACSDLGLFDSTFNLPNSGCNVIYPTGVPVLGAGNVGDAEGWSTETMIDMEYSHTMAPQAHITEVTASTDYDDLYASVEYVVNNQLANIISLSWGQWEDLFYCTSAAYGCSPPATAALLLGYDEIFQQAAAQGIGVFVSSGDYGAYDPVLGEVAGSAPATDPWVTAVGGTTLLATFTGNSVSRLETAWSLGSDSYNPIIASGGGFSMVFSEPLGQRLIHISTQVSSISLPVLGVTFNPQGMRGEPDLAADADPSTGVLVIQGGAFSPYVWGGTSLASPLTAGMDSLIQSNTRFFTIGDMAPSMYGLYLLENNGFYVHQSTFSLNQLNNGVHGTMFETASGQNGPFSVTPGVWNPVAGLGQLNVYGLSQQLFF